MRVVAVAPMPDELEAIRDDLVATGYDLRADTIGRLSVTQFPELGLTLAVGGTGKAQFGVQVQHLLDAESGWDLVICTGAAGALADRLCIGDVVVGTRTIEHDYINRFNDSPVPSFKGDPTALQSLREMSASVDGNEVHFGVIASGDEDIVEPKRRLQVRERTQALVVAWEGAGGARACKFSEVPYLEVRGVTDDADHSAPKDFSTNLQTAMSSIAELLAQWLSASGAPHG